MYLQKKICTSTESASAQLERLRKALDTRTPSSFTPKAGVGAPYRNLMTLLRPAE